MANWENNIRKVVPYTPGEQPNQPDMIKLNTNENPYPPAPGVREVLRNMDTDTLRLYPDPAALDLVRAIADTYGLSDNQVFVEWTRSSSLHVVTETVSLWSLIS